MTQASLLPFCVLLLSACHGASSPQPSKWLASAPRPPPPVRAPTPAEMTAGMVEAVTLGHSTVPVDVKFDVPQRPVVGHPLEVVIAVMPQTTAKSLSVQASGSDGLQIGPSGPIEIPTVDPTQVYRLSIPVTPLVDGVLILGVAVALNHDDGVESRAFSVPLIVTPGGASSGVAPSGASNGVTGAGRGIASTR